jgi:hypothetical protein
LLSVGSDTSEKSVKKHPKTHIPREKDWQQLQGADEKNLAVKISCDKALSHEKSGKTWKSKYVHIKKCLTSIFRYDKIVHK